MPLPILELNTVKRGLFMSALIDKPAQARKREPELVAEPDLLVRSVILREEKPGKGLVGVLPDNPHQSNRVIGCLPNGQKVVVAQRPGKGGMDFNKILGGKILAVAADGFSPIYEKEDGKRTNKQKLENGLPVFSSSGFYQLSSKEYAALDLFEAYVWLHQRGELAALVTEAQLSARKRYRLTASAALESIVADWRDLLDDRHNLVSRFDEQVNKKRNRAIMLAQGEAEDAGGDYEGAAFQALSASSKDGNPFVLISWRVGEDPVRAAFLSRQAQDTTGEHPVTNYFTPEEAIQRFMAGSAGLRIQNALNEGRSVSLAYAQGHLMRTSVMLRRKAEAVIGSSPIYGDGVFIRDALKGWAHGLIAVMHSMHPKFPYEDYDAHHYVIGLHQGTIGMNKKPGGGWHPPEGVLYQIGKFLTEPV